MYSLVLRFVEKKICGPLIENFQNLQRDKEFPILRKFVESCRQGSPQKRLIDLGKQVSNGDFTFLNRFLSETKKPVEKAKISRSMTQKTCVPIREPYKLHKFSSGPESKAHLTKEEAKLYYSQLQTIRYIDLAFEQMNASNASRGLYNSCSGQEACTVGLRAAIRNADNVITSHRCHDWSYLMGMSPSAVLTELGIRHTGCSRCKYGSLHMYSPRFFDGNGILGAQVPIGAGIALASRCKRDGGVCVVGHGDNLASKAQLYECYHLANLWKLPCVFVYVNNAKDPKGFHFYRRCGDIPAVCANGCDVLAVREATKFCINYAIESGPVLIELYTPTPSPTVPLHMKHIRQKHRDPIDIFRRICLKNDLLTMPEIQAIDRFIRLQIEIAANKVKEDCNARISENNADTCPVNSQPKLSSAANNDVPHIHLFNSKLTKNYERHDDFRGVKDEIELKVRKFLNI